jgi:hypothetical protein
MPNETFPEVMQAHAADAVASAQETPELDYSIESLRFVERLLEIRRTGFDCDDDRLRALATMWGGYLGEVLRRRWGGEWFFPEEGPFQKKICLVIRDARNFPTVRDITLFPAERAYKQLVNGSEDGIWSYACALEARLSTGGRKDSRSGDVMENPFSDSMIKVAVDDFADELRSKILQRRRELRDEQDKCKTQEPSSSEGGAN